MLNETTNLYEFGCFQFNSDDTEKRKKKKKGKDYIMITITVESSVKMFDFLKRNLTKPTLDYSSFHKRVMLRVAYCQGRTCVSFPWSYL